MRTQSPPRRPVNFREDALRASGLATISTAPTCAALRQRARSLSAFSDSTRSNADRAQALHNITWTRTDEGHAFWREVHDRRLQGRRQAEGARPQARIKAIVDTLNYLCDLWEYENGVAEAPKPLNAPSKPATPPKPAFHLGSLGMHSTGTSCCGATSIATFPEKQTHYHCRVGSQSYTYTHEEAVEGVKKQIGTMIGKVPGQSHRYAFYIIILTHRQDAAWGEVLKELGFEPFMEGKNPNSPNKLIMYGYNRAKADGFK